MTGQYVIIGGSPPVNEELSRLIRNHGIEKNNANTKLVHRQSIPFDFYFRLRSIKEKLSDGSVFYCHDEVIKTNNCIHILTDNEIVLHPSSKEIEFQNEK